MKKLYSILSLLSVCLYPNLFMYFQNAGEAKITDIGVSMALFLGTAVIVLGVCWLFMRNFYKAIALSNIAMLLIANFEVLSGVFKWSKNYYLFTLICACVLLVIIGCFVKKKESLSDNVNLLLLITMGALIIINLIPAIPVIVHKMTLKVEKPQVLSEIDENKLDVKGIPNIYYVILDEYGGKDSLMSYFEYDNQEFESYLLDKGFNISNSSRNEESVQTVTIIPNLLNLGYVVDDSMIADERLAYMEKPALYEVMKYLGYDIMTCSQTPFLDNSMSEKNYEEQEVFEDKAAYFVLKNSIFYLPYQKQKERKLANESSDEKNYGDNLVEAFQYYAKLSHTMLGDNAQFCIGYFAAPHVPFFYKSDGTLNDPGEYENWLNQENYIGYMKWTNTKIQEMIDEIISNDPESIIILQSDHGARYPVHVKELTGEQPFSEADMAAQNSILNCVYYKGEQLDIEGLSGINTLRTILNKEFNTEFMMISCD